MTNIRYELIFGDHHLHEQREERSAECSAVIREISTISLLATIGISTIIIIIIFVTGIITSSALSAKCFDPQ